jgi:hypothetical protein
MSMYEDYAKLRKSIGVIQKSGENPYFQNTYVELNTAIEVVDEHLATNGFICFIQTPINISGKNYLHTELIHKDGEKIVGDLELITTKQDPQMLGSSLTYARRYSLLTMLGLKAEDDDGNLVSGKGKQLSEKELSKIDACESVEELRVLYQNYKGMDKALFEKACMERKKQLC